MNVNPWDLLVLRGFKKLIPPPSAAEIEQLKASIEAEGIHTPVVVWEWKGRLVVVDGHNRVGIARELGINVPILAKNFRSRGEASEWMWSNQASRRNWSTFSKIVSLLQAVEPRLRERASANQKAGRPLGSKGLEVRTTQTLARMAGASESTVKKVRAIIKEPHFLEGGEAEGLRQLQRGEIPIATAHRAWRRNRRESQNRVQSHGMGAEPPSKRVRVIHGAIGEAGAKIDDGSVSLVFTDAPYGKPFLSVYSDLAEAAASKLKKGGLLACITGQKHLPEVIQRLSAHLSYLWTITLLHERLTGPGGLNRHLGIRIRWKPILLFSKGKWDNSRKFIEDVITDSRKDKRWHPHGQGVEEATYLIETLTAPDDLVWDPCCGGGTIGEAALKLGRSVVLSDSDWGAIMTTRDRLNLLDNFFAIIRRSDADHPH